MQATIELSFACGCRQTRVVRFDGRSKVARENAISLERRIAGEGGICCACEHRAAIERFAAERPVLAPYADQLAASRVRHILDAIEAVIVEHAGSVENVDVSAKSEATYITLADGRRIRVASHQPQYLSSLECEQVLVG